MLTLENLSPEEMKLIPSRCAVNNGPIVQRFRDLGVPLEILTAGTGLSQNSDKL